MKMREFDMREGRHGHGFGGHRMVKPVIMGLYFWSYLACW